MENIGELIGATNVLGIPINHNIWPGNPCNMTNKAAEQFRFLDFIQILGKKNPRARTRTSTHAYKLIQLNIPPSIT